MDAIAFARPATRIALLATLCSVGDAFAHPGELDPSFGNGGIAYFDEAADGGCRTQARAIGILEDAGIIITGVVYNGTGRKDIFVSKIGEDGRELVHRSFQNGSGAIEGRAIATTRFGDFYIGTNLAVVAAVYAFHPDLSFDTAFGPGGSVTVTTDPGFGIETRINDLVYREDDAYPVYVTGTSATGQGDMMISLFSPTGPANVQTFALSAGVNTATALGVFSDGAGLHAIVGGYGDQGCIQTSMQPVYDAGSGGWTFDFDPLYAAGVYGFAGAAGCYTDAMTVLPDHSQIAAGRVLNGDGSWSAFLQHFSPTGDRIAPGRIFQMSPWGDNSIRRIVVQPDGKWLMVGFTGVDAQSSPGAWVGRFLPSGDLDTTYANGGANLIDFDTQDFANGRAFGAVLDATGRLVVTGIYGTGTSDVDGNDCTLAFVARFQNDDSIFGDGFDG